MIYVIFFVLIFLNVAFGGMFDFFCGLLCMISYKTFLDENIILHIIFAL
jgi:hypothetical protein